MAIVITMTVDGGTLADYAAVQRKLMHAAPDGLLLHVAHAVPEGIRLVEVWESTELRRPFSTNS